MLTVKKTVCTLYNCIVDLTVFVCESQTVFCKCFVHFELINVMLHWQKPRHYWFANAARTDNSLKVLHVSAAPHWQKQHNINIKRLSPADDRCQTTSRRFRICACSNWCKPYSNSNLITGEICLQFCKNDTFPVCLHHT